MPTHATQPRLWTIPEVAQYLGVHEHTVRRKIADGQLPAIKLGDEPRNAIRVSETALTHWLKEHAR